MTSVCSGGHTSADNNTVIADPDSGFFCRPGCEEIPETDCRLRAYASPKNALEWGYRPCPVCRPMDLELNSSDSPEDGQRLHQLMKDIAENPDFTVKAAALMKRGLDPDRLRRRYQNEYDLSLGDFLRMRRVNMHFGIPQKSEDSHKDEDLVFTRIGTTLGPMLAAASGKGLCLLEFAERRMMETQIRRLEKYNQGSLRMGQRPLLKKLEEELDEYFRGDRQNFTIAMHLRGSEFQMKVWAELMKIPYGSTRSYSEQARALGNPQAVRAVARANGDNPVSILVPCHRVLGSDGTMTGYGGRIWRKEALLALESGQGELFS